MTLRVKLPAKLASRAPLAMHTIGSTSGRDVRPCRALYTSRRPHLILVRACSTCRAWQCALGAVSGVCTRVANPIATVVCATAISLFVTSAIILPVTRVVSASHNSSVPSVAHARALGDAACRRVRMLRTNAAWQRTTHVLVSACNTCIAGWSSITSVAHARGLGDAACRRVRMLRTNAAWQRTTHVLVSACSTCRAWQCAL
jgi:hypothetical protein